MIVIALPAAIFVREPKTTGAKGDAGSIGPVLRTPAFYLLAIGSMASIGAVGGTMQNLKLFLSLDRGLPQGEIAVTLSLILAGSLVGRLLMGWLADRWPKKHVMLLIYAHRRRLDPAARLAPNTMPRCGCSRCCSASASAVTT